MKNKSQHFHLKRKVNQGLATLWGIIKGLLGSEKFNLGLIN